MQNERRRRKNRLDLHLDDFEQKRLKDLAALYGLDASNFIRQVLRLGQVPPLPSKRVRA